MLAATWKLLKGNSLVQTRGVKASRWQEAAGMGRMGLDYIRKRQLLCP